MEEPVETTEAAAPANDLCPRCQKKIVDPGGLGWCPACGYCSSLDDERAKQLLARSTAAAPRPRASMQFMAGQIPLWFWVLIGGTAVVAVVSLAVDSWLEPGNTFNRALWTSVQVVLGLVIIFVVQLFALVLVATDDEKLGFKDVLVPTRLWPAVCKRLPAMAPYLWAATWALTMSISALIFIGGLPHWFSYLPNSKNAAAEKAKK
jgi:hypothetical protein